MRTTRPQDGPGIAPEDVDALEKPLVAPWVLDVLVGDRLQALRLAHEERAYDATDGDYHEREPEGVVHAY